MAPYPYARALADELRTLRLVYKLSIAAIDLHRFGLPPTKRNWETWDHADQFILESINEQLNRIVDGSIFSAFARLRSGLRLKETRWGRKDMLNEFQKRFRVDVAALPGWQEVQDVAHDANATKHRAGVHWAKTTTDMAKFDGTVQLHRRVVNRRIREVAKWLRAFGIAHGVP